MSTQKTYSPKKVKAVYAGALTISGFAEGTSIQASRAVDNSTQEVGMQGDVGLTATANSTGTITFTLMQNSESNRYLSAIQNAQDIDCDLYRAGITISDPSGGYLCHAEGCHIMTTPEMTLGDTQESKVWVFFVENLQFLAIGELTDDGAIISRAKNAIDAAKAISSNLA